jgi:hypothetical protein
MHIERTSFRLVKIYWTTADELIKELNALMAKKLISVDSAVPDATTTAHCSAVYYEYYL